MSTINADTKINQLMFVFLMQPYGMVKDLWINYEVLDPDSVLEGELDCCIISYLSTSMDKDKEDY